MLIPSFNVYSLCCLVFHSHCQSTQSRSHCALWCCQSSLSPLPRVYPATFQPPFSFLIYAHCSRCLLKTSLWNIFYISFKQIATLPCNLRKHGDSHAPCPSGNSYHSVSFAFPCWYFWTGVSLPTAQCFFPVRLDGAYPCCSSCRSLNLWTSVQITNSLKSFFKKFLLIFTCVFFFFFFGCSEFSLLPAGFIVVYGLLIVVASLVMQHRL